MTNASGQLAQVAGRRLARSAGLLALGLATILASGLMTGASAMGATAPPTPYGVNLVKNPGAEKGPTGEDIRGWTNLGAEVRAYCAEPGFPCGVDGAGDRLFHAGCGGLQQVIRLKGRASAIDASKVRLNVKALVGTDGPTAAHVAIDFFDSQERNLGNEINIGAYDSASTMLKVNDSRKLPKRTRLVRVLLYSSLGGETCDAFYDNVSVVIKHL
jgi:hypothetical protein